MTTMHPSHVHFLQAAKALPGGVTEGFQILSLIQAWEGEASEESNVIHLGSKTSKFLEKAAQAGQVLLDLDPPRPRGRKKGEVNPNSNCQRIWRTIRECLQAHGEPMHYSDLLPHIMQVTGLTADKIRWSAMQCPGIRRDYGMWSLKEAA